MSMIGQLQSTRVVGLLALLVATSMAQAVPAVGPLPHSEANFVLSGVNHPKGMGQIGHHSFWSTIFPNSRVPVPFLFLIIVASGISFVFLMITLLLQLLWNTPLASRTAKERDQAVSNLRVLGIRTEPAIPAPLQDDENVVPLSTDAVTHMSAMDSAGQLSLATSLSGIPVDGDDDKDDKLPFGVSASQTGLAGARGSKKLKDANEIAGPIVPVLRNDDSSLSSDESEGSLIDEEEEEDTYGDFQYNDPNDLAPAYESRSHTVSGVPILAPLQNTAPHATGREAGDAQPDVLPPSPNTMVPPSPSMLANPHKAPTAAAGTNSNVTIKMPARRASTSRRASQASTLKPVSESGRAQTQALEEELRAVQNRNQRLEADAQALLLRVKELEAESLKQRISDLEAQVQQNTASVPEVSTATVAPLQASDARMAALNKPSEDVLAAPLIPALVSTSAPVPTGPVAAPPVALSVPPLTRSTPSPSAAVPAYTAAPTAPEYAPAEEVPTSAIPEYAPASAEPSASAFAPADTDTAAAASADASAYAQSETTDAASVPSYIP